MKPIVAFIGLTAFVTALVGGVAVADAATDFGFSFDAPLPALAGPTDTVHAPVTIVVAPTSDPFQISNGFFDVGSTSPEYFSTFDVTFQAISSSSITPHTFTAGETFHANMLIFIPGSADDVVAPGTYSINAARLGTNTGFTANSSNLFSIQVGVVPEPSTLVLLGAGIVGVGLRLRKR
jgi:hypothetical protein